jgi:hypothetical protein
MAYIHDFYQTEEIQQFDMLILFHENPSYNHSYVG